MVTCQKLDKNRSTSFRARVVPGHQCPACFAVQPVHPPLLLRRAAPVCRRAPTQRGSAAPSAVLCASGHGVAAGSAQQGSRHLVKPVHEPRHQPVPDTCKR
eukprot:6210841-Pleurochrysis_carterae.AAC.4